MFGESKGIYTAETQTILNCVLDPPLFLKVILATMPPNVSLSRLPTYKGLH